MRKLINAAIDRMHDLLLSIYLFNEQRGFTYLDHLAEAFEAKYPNEKVILAAVRKHARDERNHYRLFCQYFIDKGVQPFDIDHRFGVCDLMVESFFGKPISELDPRSVVNDDEMFFRLCRLIMITEARGMKQVDLLLKNPLIRRNAAIVDILKVVEKDEPSHTYPYRHWLKKHGQHMPSFREMFVDYWVNAKLVSLRFPFLFLNVFLRRRNEFPVPMPVYDELFAVK